MLPISGSEDPYGLSDRLVPAHVLPHHFSGTALVLWLAHSPAFPFQNKSGAHYGASSAQATHPRRLPCLSSRHHSFEGAGPDPSPVRPWREVKSRRGAPKRVNTEGYACPNPQCAYFGITDPHMHALVGDGKHGHAERIQTFRCQACCTTFSSRRDTPLYRLKTPSQQVALVLSALAEGLDPSAVERVFGYRQATIISWLTRAGGTLKVCTSARSAPSGCRICSWTNCAPGSAVPTRFSGSGWRSIPSPRLFRCLSWVLAHNIWPIG